MAQLTDYIRVLKAFEESKVDYILVGGFAIILHGMQRLTRDIDVFVKMVPENIEKLRKALHSVFEDPSIEEITLDELQRYPVIRYGTPHGFFIDIMSRLGDVATYDDTQFEIVEFEETKIKIATPEALYHLKKNTVRPEDKRDAMFLRELIKADK
ncbi:MAG: nucleotidyl transferase AbiEii/AbiGii toxin family protein [Candidatus Thorarchaeota archaeon]